MVADVMRQLLTLATTVVGAACCLLFEDDLHRWAVAATRVAIRDATTDVVDRVFCHASVQWVAVAAILVVTPVATTAVESA